MERLGILTGADLKAKSLDFLQANFGKSGGWYFRISRGIDERPVQRDRPRKSVGAEDTFMVDIFDMESAKSELVPLAEKVWRHCEAKQISGRTVTLKVKYADFQQITRSRTVTRAIRGEIELQQVAQVLLDDVFPTTKGIRLLGITLSALESEEAPSVSTQMELL
jgi:DNA polymerase-4